MGLELTHAGDEASYEYLMKCKAQNVPALRSIWIAAVLKNKAQE